MKRDKLFRLSLAILFLWTSFALAAPAAIAASSTVLPGSSLWEPYLQQSRIDLEKAASSPWETLKSFLPRSFGALVRQTASRYTSVLLFLTLTAVLGLLAGECTDGALLDLVAAGGCGVLLWGSLLEEAQKLCEQVESWRSFLLGFLPVYAGVLTMGGEGAAGSAASGALLTALCFLAQLAAGFVQPLLHCYLMLSMACCVSSEPALGIFCKGVGSALRQALGWAGKILVALLGLQRAAAFQLDRFSLRTGQLLAGRSHHRADSQQCIGIHPRGDTAPQERAGAGSSVGAGRGVRAALSGADDTAGSSDGMQSALQSHWHLPLPRIIRLFCRGGALYGSGGGAFLRAGGGRGNTAVHRRRWFMMQALERAAAVFCTACICAELLSRFVGQGWGQKCIKAVAGLYILVVFADALPGAKAQFTALELPQVPMVSVGSLEDAVLAQTAEELSRTLEERCLSEAGVSLRLNIILSQTAEGVEAAEVQIVPQDAVTASQKRAIEALLEGQLQLGPECIKWNSPSGEDVL